MLILPGRAGEGRTAGWGVNPKLDMGMIAMSGSVQHTPHRRARPGVDAGKLWSGGAASAVVTGLLALAGVLISRWLFDLPVLAPKGDGTYGNVRTTAFVLAAAVGALLATGLVHLLMLAVPRPLLFFGWIIGLVTAIIVAFPFSTSAALEAKIATAIVDLVIGVATGVLVSGAASRSRTYPSALGATDPYYQPPRYQGP